MYLEQGDQVADRAAAPIGDVEPREEVEACQDDRQAQKQLDYIRDMKPSRELSTAEQAAEEDPAHDGNQEVQDGVCGNHGKDCASAIPARL